MGDALTSGGGRLAGVDVADNDDVDMSLLLTACRQLALRRWNGYHKLTYPILMVFLDVSESGWFLEVVWKY